MRMTTTHTECHIRAKRESKGLGLVLFICSRNNKSNHQMTTEYLRPGVK